MNKIHFINRIDYKNAGDRSCCPLNYFYTYFSKFNIFRHDIDYIRWEMIDRDDVVVIGGGGALNCTIEFNRNINRLLEKCDCVIGWSLGFNTHTEVWRNNQNYEKIDFKKFKLISIRDFNHSSNLEYVPDPSVFELKNVRFSDVAIKRKIGFIEHKDLPLDIDRSKFNIFNDDWIKHDESIGNIIKFIASSSEIVTNSYHVAYWSILLNKKTLVLNKWSTKFDGFKYKPIFVSSDSISSLDDIELYFKEASTYPNAFNDCVKLNNDFFAKVKSLINSVVSEEKIDLSTQLVDQLTYPYSWNVQDNYIKINKNIDDITILFNKIRQLESKNKEQLDVCKDLYNECTKLNNLVVKQQNNLRSLSEKTDNNIIKVKQVIYQGGCFIKLTLSSKSMFYKILFAINKREKYLSKKKLIDELLEIFYALK